MQIVERVIVAERASALFRRELEKCRPGANGLVALVYIASFLDRDRTPIEGFAPGYIVGPLGSEYVSERWIRAKQSGLPEFYVDPRGGWGGASAMSIDLAATKYAMFSIVPS